MGRPPFPAGKAKSKEVMVRFTPAMHRAMVKAAKRQGKPLTAWIREAVARALTGGD
ncbi:MAG: toxin-antitoxin system HicB family antitoxin [Phycisphaerales bacterium]|nr:MAG: toxin-antitoxin system HicB family antitoxin [Phycisphaerales bacterium]